MSNLLKTAIITLSLIALILFIFIKLNPSSDISTKYLLELSCTHNNLILFSSNLPTFENWMDINTYMPWKNIFLSDLVNRCYNAYSLTTNNSNSLYNKNNFVLPPSLNLSGNIYTYTLETIITGNSDTLTPGVTDGEALYGGVFSFRKNNVNTGIYIVAFRGTQNVSDWIQNVSTGKECANWLYENTKVQLCGSKNNCATILSLGQSGCQVHTGWNEIYTSSPSWSGSRKTSMQYQLRTWLNNNINSVKQLIFTGHSLGAAVVQLFFLDVYLNYTFSFPISLITFASPRPFNKNLTDVLTSSFNVNINKVRIMNFINSVDIATKVPLETGVTVYGGNFKTLPNVYFKPSINRTVVEEIKDDKNPFGYTESQTTANINLFHCLTTYQKIVADVTPRFVGSTPVHNTYYMIYFMNSGSIVKNSNNTLTINSKPGHGSKFLCLYNGTYWSITNYDTNALSIAQSASNTNNTMIVSGTYYAFKFFPNNDYNNTFTIFSGVSNNYLGSNLQFSSNKFNVIFIKV